MQNQPKRDQHGPPMDQRAERRTLQYIADAITRRPGEDTWIDLWLIEHGCAADSLRNGLAVVAGIDISIKVPGIARTADDAPEYVCVQAVDRPAARARLNELEAHTAARRSDFVYMEEWPDAAEATEAADRLLDTDDDAEDDPAPSTGIEKPMTPVQLQVLRHAAAHAARRRSWLTIDAWAAEQAARDAEHGYGRATGRGPTRWSDREAEFNIHGMWLRLDNRRDDETRNHDEGRGLLSEMRILQPRRLLRTMRALKLDELLRQEHACAPAM